MRFLKLVKRIMKNRFPRPDSRGSLILAQDSLHLRHKYQRFFARNKNNLIVWSFLTILYFTTRLVNLKLIPIFTDEAIYARWAQIALHDPVNRFISLEDGKQPLFIWLAAIAQKFISDPLIATRLVSVFAGFGSLCGIYLLAKELFGSKTAKLAAFAYVVLPFTLLYDKLGIYDSLLTMLGIWAVYFTLKMAKKPSLDYALLNGFAIGLGLITKSSASFFLYLLPFSLFQFDFGKTQVLKRLFDWFKLTLVTFVLAELFYNSLRLSPLFYIIKRKNYEFIRPFSEVLTNPLHSVFSNFKALAQWLIIYIGWPLFIVFLIGIFLGISRRDKKIIYLAILILTPFTAEVIFNKVLYPRFILFYFPYVILTIVYTFTTIQESFKKYQKQIALGFLLFLVIPAYTSFKILTNPAYANIPQSDSNQYFNDWPAGYGVDEIVEILRRQSESNQIHVATEGTFGLMPFALNIYFFQNNNLHISSYWPLDPDNLPNEIFDVARNQKTYAIFYQTQKEPTKSNLKLVAKYQKGKGNSFMRLYEVVIND